MSIWRRNDQALSQDHFGGGGSGGCLVVIIMIYYLLGDSGVKIVVKWRWENWLDVGISTRVGHKWGKVNFVLGTLSQPLKQKCSENHSSLKDNLDNYVLKIIAVFCY